MFRLFLPGWSGAVFCTPGSRLKRPSGERTSWLTSARWQSAALLGRAHMPHSHQL
jgi:hypothetical protein